MITITETINDFYTYDKILGYSPESSLFFDIETTGFSANTSVVFLIGALGRENGVWKLTQFLARRPQEERTVLEAFFSLASRYDTLVHFNGTTFDLPYLNKKATQHGLAHMLNSHRSLDLYRSYRPLQKLLGLARMNQTSLEAFLGWQRRDRLSGKHMVKLFGQYAASGDTSVQELLLLHNHDDMLGMTQLTGLAAHLALVKGEFREITEITEESDRKFLRISFALSCPVPVPFSAADGTYRLEAEGARGCLRVPLCEGTFYHLFPDYKNYWYLPLEDQAIHKSVASFVDKAYRVPATAANCYIKKSGAFLPQPEELFAPAFKRTPDGCMLYFLYSEDFTVDSAAAHDYAAAVLQTVTRNCESPESVC